jgi:YD repeat-containing protein
MLWIESAAQRPAGSVHLPFPYGCYFGYADNCSVSRGEAAMRAIPAAVVLLLLGVAADASETITYTYDARGRLVNVVRSGTINNNVVTNYIYDETNNRKSKTTTGSPNPPPP